MCKRSTDFRNRTWCRNWVQNLLKNSPTMNDRSCILYLYQNHSTHTQFYGENNLNFFPKQYPLFVLPVWRISLPHGLSATTEFGWVMTSWAEMSPVKCSSTTKYETFFVFWLLVQTTKPTDSRTHPMSKPKVWSTESSCLLGNANRAHYHLEGTKL